VLTTTHLFAGGLGDGRGFDDAGFHLVYAANHAAPAVATARANWPTIRAQRADINNLDMRSVPATDGLVGSPICTEVTPAGGQSAPRLQGELVDDGSDAVKPADWSRTRMTAWDPIRYAEVHRPLFYAGENVPGFATRWELFGAWVNVWDALGYYPVFASVDAAHISGVGFPTVPQHRHRFVWCFIRKDLKQLPDLRPRPDAMCPTCGPVQGVQQWSSKRWHANSRARKAGEYGDHYQYVCPNRRCGHREVAPVTRGIGEVIDMTVRGHRFGDGRQDRKEFTPYVAATRRRVEIGLERFGGEPFVITLRKNGTASSLDEPIGTLSAQGGNHHMLVRPDATGVADDCEVRALAIREKAAAQGFPEHHVLAGKETEQKLLIGNAVPVNVARWLGERIRAVAS
jgi:DNA (cytosine-5)-methyltransferase 1